MEEKVNKAMQALLDLSGRNKKQQRIQEGAAATANYLDVLLGQQQGDVTLPRTVVIGMQSVLRSSSKAMG